MKINFFKKKFKNKSDSKNTSKKISKETTKEIPKELLDLNSSEMFIIRSKKVHKEIREVYDNSTALKFISTTLRSNLKTQNDLRNAFNTVSSGLQRKYNLKLEFVEPGVVQKQTKQLGNYSTYVQEKNTIVMEKLFSKTNSREIDWHHMLTELRHEYGYFLLLKKYGSRENIPKVGNRYATHILDSIHD